MMGFLLRDFGTYGLPCYFSILSEQKYNVLPSPKLVSHRGTYFNMVRVSLGENGKLHVGVRRAMRQQANIPLSVISSHSMHIGVLATAWHAYRTRTFFTVYYKPRFTGTIIGIEDVDTKRWAESKWRSLKVRWDESSTIPSLERVSPWKIEPALTTVALNPLPMPRLKRPRSSMVPFSPDSSVLTRESMRANSSLCLWYNNFEAMKPKDRNCRLFGIPLISNHITMKPAHLHKTTIENNQRFEQIKGVSVADQPLPSVSGKTIPNVLATCEDCLGKVQGGSTRSCTKAQNKNWLIVFIDDDGGMMLVGDDPWP
ncbi:Auxin response factor 2B [Camellia lanceoleosa]|uniref:Auxin response factor 2B n=1 Tax=Camellia lanceoleosa TaxID=1840588 RepID=A0ACC0GHJ6_9ERIC|nr:Auxin response factor 2B [Camellia lanceoleosa]